MPIIEVFDKMIIALTIVFFLFLINSLKISINDIAFKRPMGGLEPRYLDDLLGKRLNKDLKKNSYILFKDVS